MSEADKLKNLKTGFNRVVNRITSYRCEKACYSAFERFLHYVGVPNEIIEGIYLDSGFTSWDGIHQARLKDKYSIPVHKSMGKIKGVASAVNKMLDIHIEKIMENEKI